MSRQPKPTQLHVVDGTYRGHRHKSRGNSSAGGGHPPKPAGLCKYGLECWQKFVEPVIRLQVAVEIDSLAVAEACRLYAFYRRSCEAAAKAPTDKLARCAVVAYWTAFERVAAKYGLTPADRLRLVPPERSESEDPADKHFRNSA